MCFGVNERMTESIRRIKDCESRLYFSCRGADYISIKLQILLHCAAGSIIACICSSGLFQVFDRNVGHIANTIFVYDSNLKMRYEEVKLTMYRNKTISFNHAI